MDAADRNQITKLSYNEEIQPNKVLVRGRAAFQDNSVSWSLISNRDWIHSLSLQRARIFNDISVKDQPYATSFGLLLVNWNSIECSTGITLFLERGERCSGSGQ